MQTSDFEDNIQVARAQLAGLNAIATRDANDFAAAPIPAYTPGHLGKLLYPDTTE
jgi:hypothetical protein